MPPRRRGVAQGGAGNQEIEELIQRIEELNHRRIGDAKLDSELKEEIDEEQDTEERDPTTRLISYLRNRGSARVEVSCYNGNMRVDVFIKWIGKLERYIEYGNV